MNLCRKCWGVERRGVATSHQESLSQQSRAILLAGNWMNFSEKLFFFFFKNLPLIHHHPQFVLYDDRIYPPSLHTDRMGLILKTKSHKNHGNDKEGIPGTSGTPMSLLHPNTLISDSTIGWLLSSTIVTHFPMMGWGLARGVSVLITHTIPNGHVEGYSPSFSPLVWISLKGKFSSEM